MKGQTPRIQPPASRALQIYAFDPSLDLDLQTAHVNRSVVHVRWEGDLHPGPVGEYVEVVDVDPASQCVYAPIDLNHPHLLARDGLSPSEGNPQFHQQMVYAVAMKTIEHFEVALGRSVHWSPRIWDENGKRLRPEEAYVPRLRIYPHAMREANAYYSPDKKALLFGYFNAVNTDAREGLPGGLVFSCLSHDVIAHEMTHAILDGIHRRLLEPSNPDVLAFHEAFADLVAIFQHFTLPGVLEHQIAKTRGDLSTENLLAKLAVQFGRATRRGNALRDALGGEQSESGEWKRQSPDPTRINKVVEPHARGAILVAAVFDAFVTVYQAHTADLLRIASEGRGVLRHGALHPDLVRRMAAEAEKVARRILMMSIRALDYLPPVDVTFGDFLRAVITSDTDLVPEDAVNYRVAWISAFRDRGIYPRDVRTLSVESLRWCPPSEEEQALLQQLLPPVSILRVITLAQDLGLIDLDQPQDSSRRSPDEQEHDPDREMREVLINEFLDVTPHPQPAVGTKPRCAEQARNADEEIRALRRRDEFLSERLFARYFHQRLRRRTRALQDEDMRTSLANLLGVDFFQEDLKFEVHAVRPATRVRRDGRTTTELLVLITQRLKDELPIGEGEGGALHFRFRSGCTLLIDPLSGHVRYAIVKRVGDQQSGRRARQKQFLQERLNVEGTRARPRYHLWQGNEEQLPQEPFRLLHRSEAGEEWL